ncbi:MAG: DUF4416 family protein [Planctomycetes bacterium]|nr:DUF4416 family protein [Planctomycetota bacterium]
MGKPRAPAPVKLICGLLAGDEDLLQRARQRLGRHYGPIDLASDVWPFSQTRYYEPEMGPDLKRQFVSFEKRVAVDRLAEIKLATNEIERDLADERVVLGVPRPVNLDPGLIDSARLILATTKDRSHRIYVGDGIYAEVTLHWSDGAWRVWPWTYPDYHEPAYCAFFTLVRQRLAEQVRTAAAADGAES